MYEGIMEINIISNNFWELKKFTKLLQQDRR